MSRRPATAPRRGFVRRVRELDFWLSTMALISGVFLLVFLMQTVAFSVAVAVSFEGYATNGALQVYNPLRRIAVGELPGGDFPFFHGVGVPWIHYPLFELFGGNIFASELSRQLVSPLLFLLSCALFFAVFFKDGRRTVIATGVFTAFSIAFNDVISPGNSLIGVRSFLPILVATVLLWKPKHRWPIGPIALDARLLLALLGLGVAVSFGTEQAIAAIGAYIVVRVLVLWRHARWWALVLQLLVEGLILLVVALGTLTLLTGGHAVDALRYALVDIPQDQGWYFGAPPNRYLSVAAIIELMSADQVPFMIFTAIATIAVVRVAVRLERTDAHQRRTYLYLAIYGVLACVSFFGYFWPAAQMVPLARATGMILIAVSLDLALSRRSWISVRRRVDTLGLALRDLAVVALAVVLSGLVIGAFAQLKDLRSLPLAQVVARGATAGSLSDAEIAGPGWRERLEAFDEYIPDGATIWSTYASLYESTRGIFQPSSSGDDYIIHALGDGREQYSADFEAHDPDFVITMKPSYFLYEEWLWGANSEFYESLLREYRLVAANSAHYLWERRTDAPSANAEWQTAERAADGSFQFPTDGEASLYEVAITYSATGGLPFTDRIPRYLVTAIGTGLTYQVSLPSGRETTHTLLVPMMAGQEVATLNGSAWGILATAELTIDNVEYRRIDLADENLALFLDNYCSYAPAADQVYTDSCTATSGGSPVTDPPHSP